MSAFMILYFFRLKRFLISYLRKTGTFEWMRWNECMCCTCWETWLLAQLTGLHNVWNWFSVSLLRFPSSPKFCSSYTLEVLPFFQSLILPVLMILFSSPNTPYVIGNLEIYPLITFFHFSLAIFFSNHNKIEKVSNSF